MIYEIYQFQIVLVEIRMKLYNYQVKYLSSLPKNVIMSADTGTGKTLMSLAHAESHSPGVPILILAPASKVRTGDWEREAEEFGVDKNRITVMSYERATRKATFSAWAKGKPTTWWQGWLQTTPEFVLIADETHKAKNPQSLTGKGVFALATSPQCKQFIGLSATPLPNGWVDIANYGKIFGWWPNKTEFYRRHVIEKKIPNQHWSKIVGYHDQDQLKKLWLSVASPLKKSDALDLPKLKYQKVDIEKPSIYNTVQKTRIYRAEELDNAPKLVSGLRRTLIESRIKWLKDFLEGASGHTIIFYNYIEEREAILASVPLDMAVYRQDGEKHELPSKPEWSSLPERTVTVAHYKSGGTGVEMTYADKLVYLSPTYSYADFSQSVGRVYRNGQTLPVIAYLLHTPNTIDAAIWKCIQHKQTFDEELWVQKTLDSKISV